MSLSKKHYKKIAELIGKHTVKPNLKTETNVNFIAYGFVCELAEYFIEDSKKKPEGFRFKPDTFYDAIRLEHSQKENFAIIKVDLNNVTEEEENKKLKNKIKVLQSKVKTYEADIEEVNKEKYKASLRSANDLKGTIKLF